MRLVLLPGLDGTGDLFDPFVAALDPGVNVDVIRYPTADVHSYQQHIDYVWSRLPVDEAFVILGESFSGPVAISIAARRPGGLAGLVLCCTFVRCPLPVPRFFGYLTNLLPVHFLPDFLMGFLLLQYPLDKGLTDKVKRAVNSVSVRILQQRLRAVVTVDVAAELASVDLPVLNISACNDRLVPVRATSRIESLCRHAQNVRVPGPHALLQCDPRTTAPGVAGFIRSLMVR